MNNKKNILSLSILLFSICLFLNNYCMFFWSTYSSTSMISIYRLISYCGVVFLFSVALISKRIKHTVSISGLAVLALVIINIIHRKLISNSTMQMFSITDGVILLCVVLLVLLDDKSKKDIFSLSLKIFVIVCLPSLIYFVLSFIGINIPHSILQSSHALKSARGLYYDKYFFGLILKTPYQSDRFCGIFDEPGVVGTLAAIFFAGGYKKMNKVWLILLLIEGFFSLSLAFYFLLMIFVIIRAICDGLAKFAICGIVLIMLLTFFLNIKTDNEFITNIQNRMDLSSSFIFIDNRTSDAYEDEFNSFLQGDKNELFFGRGSGAAESNYLMSSSWSYKNIIYDYGMIGFCLLIIFVVMCFVYGGIGKSSACFFVVFLISIYQRPDIFNVEYISILICGIAYNDERVHDKSNLINYSYSKSGD